jgi:superfamily II DNA helicase RecQ
MGIDKADVRYVIHYSLSQSLEAYYQVRPHFDNDEQNGVDLFLLQETGRAGRDGMNSVCVLYYAYGDTKLLMRLIDEGDGTPEQKDHNRANLRRVVQYCMNESDCRRSQVLQYFGENFTKESCHKTCDNCMAPKNLEQRDVTGLAKDAVLLIKDMQKDKGVTMLYAIDVFRGSKSQKVRFPSSFSSLFP